MRITGVHGYYKAVRDAESFRGYRRRAAEFREKDRERANMIAERTTMPEAVPAKIRKLATDDNLAAECKLPGVTVMKRIHCLKYQVGTVNSPKQRNIVTEEGEQWGVHHRYKVCAQCSYWLADDEWKLVMQMLKACGGWDEFQAAAKATRNQRTGKARIEGSDTAPGMEAA